MDILDHNRKAWNREAERGNAWTVPVSSEAIEAARIGDFSIVLTPHKPVPTEWLGDIEGVEVLCLASGGGQQGPILAAAGATVTVLDNSDAQLARDRELSDAHDLGIRTVQGNMQDLSCFEDAAFEVIIHPVSNCFIDDIGPVWKECGRVLKPGGRLLSGFCNPVLFMVDWESVDSGGALELVHAIPHSDLESLSAETKARYVKEGLPFEFGHSLADQIQGQINAGFVITGLYEDKGIPTMDRITETFIATLATKSI